MTLTPLARMFASALIEGNINHSNRLAAQLIKTGAIRDFWLIVFQVWMKHIHLKNLALLIWLTKQFQKQIVVETESQSQRAKNLVIQITTLVALAPKSKLNLEPSVHPPAHPSAHPSAHPPAISATTQLLCSHYQSEDCPTALAQLIEAYNDEDLTPCLHWLAQLKPATVKPFLMDLTRLQKVEGETLQAFNTLILLFSPDATLPIYLYLHLLKNYQTLSFGEVEILHQTVIQKVLHANDFF